MALLVPGHLVVRADATAATDREDIFKDVLALFGAFDRKIVPAPGALVRDIEEPA